MGSGQSTPTSNDSRPNSGNTFSSSIVEVPYTANSGPGQKKALIVGINYRGTTSQLNGCINDAHTAQNYFTNLGFQCQLLTDDSPIKPTRSNILTQLNTIMSGLTSGDTVIIYYSGHGGLTVDTSGDELYGRDSVIFPLDYRTSGSIVDDTLRTYLVQAPTGVNIFCVFDACNSGSVCDLRYNLFDTSYKSNPGDKSSELITRNKVITNSNYSETNANILSLSGSKDDQLSVEIYVNGVATGALTYALFAFLKSQTPNKTLEELIQGVRSILNGFGLSQNPSMMSGRSIDTSSIFSNFINV
jgi:hypothetical protein